MEFPLTWLRPWTIMAQYSALNRFLGLRGSSVACERIMEMSVLAMQCSRPATAGQVFSSD
jgi:hypothetical protein